MPSIQLDPSKPIRTNAGNREVPNVLRARGHWQRGLRPPGEAARTSFGLMPNSRRNARVKLEASAKHSISATAVDG